MCVDTELVEFKIEELALYRKKNVPVYYIESLDVAENGETVHVPTLEGVVEVTASCDQFIMIGPCNDIYPIPRSLFESRYEMVTDAADEGVLIQIRNLGWNPEAVMRCRLIKDSYVYAKEIPFSFAVYVKHCNSTIYGKPGDYYAATYEDPENRYVIDGCIMNETYEIMQ